MNQKVVLLPILLLLLALAVAGCTRSDSESQSGEGGDASAVEGDESATRAVPMRLTDEGAARSETTPADDAPPVQSAQRASPPPAPPRNRPADPKDTAFAEVRFQFNALYPHDTQIGLLQHSYVGTISDRSAYSAARGLLTALVAGELSEDALDPDLGRGARAILGELLWKASGLADVRLGRVYQLSETDVSLPFRLLGDANEAVGELVLTNEDGRWYTSDVQVEYRSRQSERRFDPASTSGRAGR